MQRAQLIARPDFPLQVPFRLAQKMAKGTLDDPLVKQFLPLSKELQVHPQFVLDPVCDASFQEEGKLLRKYEGRVLLVCTSACAMHCRYCFRQHFAYSSSRGYEEELTSIEQDLSIHEVILSGGDPLSLSDEILGQILGRLAKLPHIRRIRFHTRFPIGIPERIDEEFLNLIASLPQQIYFVIHCNHPRELDQEIFDRLRALQRLGCIILNQAVLLKGINDNASTLQQLAEQLVNQGILFYYLHQLDRVQGAAHFEVDEEKGRALIAEIAKQLPGYAVPKYVREVAGEPHKTPL
jgi:EF-P beta-lysylation protein EpmB